MTPATTSSDQPDLQRGDTLGRPTPRRRGSDAYDTLLWRLQPHLGERDGAGMMIGVTSCKPRAGVSTVAANLAIRAADHQMRPTLLIDANPARPQVDRQFRLRDAAGLADVLAGQCGLQEAIHATSVEGLEAMPIGTPGLMDRVGLDPQHVDALLQGLRESHEMIVIDLPPASDLRHMLLVARRLDAALLAIRSESTARDLAERTATRLRADGVALAGSVVTRRREHVPSWIRRRL